MAEFCLTSVFFGQILVETNVVDANIDLAIVSYAMICGLGILVKRFIFTDRLVLGHRAEEVFLHKRLF